MTLHGTSRIISLFESILEYHVENVRSVLSILQCIYCRVRDLFISNRSDEKPSQWFKDLIQHKGMKVVCFQTCQNYDHCHLKISYSGIPMQRKKLYARTFRFLPVFVGRVTDRILLQPSGRLL